MESLDQGAALVSTMKGMKDMKAQTPQKTKLWRPSFNSATLKLINDSIRKFAELSLHALHVLHGRPSRGFFSTNGRYPQICCTPHSKALPDLATEWRIDDHHRRI